MDTVYETMAESLYDNDINGMIKSFNALPQAETTKLLQILCERAKSLFRAKQYAEAKEIYLQIVLVRSEPTDVTNYALCMIRCSEYEQAVQFLKSYPQTTSKYYFLLAKALTHQSKSLEALEYLTPLTEKFPTDLSIKKYYDLCVKSKQQIEQIINPDAVPSDGNDINEAVVIKPEVLKYDFLGHHQITMKQKWYKDSPMARGIHTYLKSLSNTQSVSLYLRDSNPCLPTTESTVSGRSVLLSMCSSEPLIICEPHAMARRLLEGMIAKHALPHTVNENNITLEPDLFSSGRVLWSKIENLKIYCSGVTATTFSHLYLKPMRVKIDDLTLLNKDRILLNLVELGWHSLEFSDKCVGVVYSYQCDMMREPLYHFITGSGAKRYRINHSSLEIDFTTQQTTKAYPKLILGDFNCKVTVVSSVYSKPIKLETAEWENINVGDDTQKNHQLIVHNLMDIGGLGGGVLHYLSQYKKQEVYPRHLKIWGCLIEKRFEETLYNPYLWSSEYRVLNGSYIQLTEPILMVSYDLLNDTPHEEQIRAVTMNCHRDGNVCAFSTWYETEDGVNLDKTVRFIPEFCVKKDEQIEGEIVNNSVEITFRAKHDKKSPPRVDQYLILLQQENQQIWKGITEIIQTDSSQYSKMMHILHRFSLNPRAFNILPEVLFSLFNKLCLY